MFYILPVVSGESLPLLVGVRADEASEEELQEGDGSPEEVGDGAQTPGLGLKHPTIGGYVHHRVFYLLVLKLWSYCKFLVSMRLMILSSFSL